MRKQPQQQVQATILFADLVNSSDIANYLDLKRYDDLISGYHQLGFSVARAMLRKFRIAPRHREVSAGGDEIRMFLYSPKPDDDLRCALYFSVVLKMLWFIHPFNRRRIRQGKNPEDVGVGVHCGNVILARHAGFQGRKRNIEGFAINLAKRVESRSREGHSYKVMLTDSAYHLSEQVIPYFRYAAAQNVIHKGIAQSFAVFELMALFDRHLFDCLPPEHDVHTVMKAIHENLFRCELRPWLGIITMRYLIWQDRYREALHLGHRLFSVEKHNSVIPLAISKTYAAMDELDRAIAWAERSLEIDPYHYITHSYTGDLYHRMRDYPNAIRHFEIALSSQSENLFIPGLERKIKQAKKELAGGGRSS